MSTKKLAINASCAMQGAAQSRANPASMTNERTVSVNLINTLPGADTKKLTMDLRPTKEDYRAFYADEATAARAEAYFDKLWSGGNAVVAPKEGQTELKLVSATTEELKNSQGEASEFPGGLVSLAETDNIKPKLTIYAFKFVKPGESLGMAFEGLTHVNGHWRLFPKPWKFMEGS